MADSTTTINVRSLCPHRGKRSVMLIKDPILHNGEIFFEVPETGVGTGAGKLVMGDGVTRYSQLPYFMTGSSGGEMMSPKYVYEESPTLNDHLIGDKIFYNSTAYTVLEDILAGTTLVVSGDDANVREDTLGDGLLVSVMNIPSESL